MKRSDVFAAIAAGPLALASGARLARAAGSAQGLEPVLTGGPWIGLRPTRVELTGRAVLVDVFTFECINCTRVVPNIKRLRARYPSNALAVVAVHTPEVPSYQASSAYVAREARLQGVTWPIVLDNDARIWNAYGIDAWPTQLLFDRHGVLRGRIVGDSNDAALDARVARLVAEGSP